MEWNRLLWKEDRTPDRPKAWQLSNWGTTTEKGCPWTQWRRDNHCTLMPTKGYWTSLLRWMWIQERNCSNPCITDPERVYQRGATDLWGKARSQEVRAQKNSAKRSHTNGKTHFCQTLPCERRDHADTPNPSSVYKCFLPFVVPKRTATSLDWNGLELKRFPLFIFLFFCRKELEEFSHTKISIDFLVWKKKHERKAKEET